MLVLAGTTSPPFRHGGSFIASDTSRWDPPYARIHVPLHLIFTFLFCFIKLLDCSACQSSVRGFHITLFCQHVFFPTHTKENSVSSTFNCKRRSTKTTAAWWSFCHTNHTTTQNSKICTVHTLPADLAVSPLRHRRRARTGRAPQLAAPPLHPFPLLPLSAAVTMTMRWRRRSQPMTSESLKES